MEQRRNRLSAFLRTLCVIVLTVIITKHCSVVERSEKERIRMAAPIANAFDRDYTDERWPTLISQALTNLVDDSDEEKREKLVQLLTKEFAAMQAAGLTYDYELYFPKFWSPSSIRIWFNARGAGWHNYRYLEFEMMQRDERWYIKHLAVGIESRFSSVVVKDGKVR